MIQRARSGVRPRPETLTGRRVGKKSKDGSRDRISPSTARKRNSHLIILRTPPGKGCFLWRRLLKLKIQGEVKSIASPKTKRNLSEGSMQYMTHHVGVVVSKIIRSGAFPTNLGGRIGQESSNALPRDTPFNTERCSCQSKLHPKLSQYVIHHEKMIIVMAGTHSSLR